MIDDFVELGRVVRPHGVGGAFIVSAHTENPATLLKGAGLELRSPDGRLQRRADGLTGRVAAQGLIVRIPGLRRREEASALQGWLLGLPRALLPSLPEDEVYWADLLGLAVETREGQILGRVEHLMEAGAGLILVVTDPAGREKLIPFQPEFVVTLDSGRLVLALPPGLIESQGG